MALPGWCTKFFRTRTVGKGILLIVLLLILALVTVAATAEKSITLIIDGEELPCTTKAKTVGAVLEENGLYARSSDVLTPQADELVTRDMEIILQRAFPIFLKVDGKTRLIYTMAHTAAELLLQQEVVLGDADRVSLALTAAISNGSVVQVQRVTSALVQEDVDIPFKTIQKKDATLTQGRKTVKTEGKLGVMQKTYQVVYVDGIEESRELTEEKRLQEPVNSVVAIGTKPAPIIASRSGSGTTGRVYEGMASYYGSKFHGRKTAYGFIYDKNALTCAFPDRALRGKTLRVTYLKTGRSVNVVVNDLGPHTKGRLIDLSEAAARAIGLISAGVGKVKVEVLK